MRLYLQPALSTLHMSVSQFHPSCRTLLTSSNVSSAPLHPSSTDGSPSPLASSTELIAVSSPSLLPSCHTLLVRCDVSGKPLLPRLPYFLSLLCHSLLSHGLLLGFLEMPQPAL